MKGTGQNQTFEHHEFMFHAAIHTRRCMDMMYNQCRAFTVFKRQQINSKQKLRTCTFSDKRVHKNIVFIVIIKKPVITM